MIKIDKETLAECIQNIENLSNEYEDILDRIAKQKEEMELTSDSEVILPHLA